MPGFPDDQRVSGWTWPIDITQVRGNTNIFTFTGAGTQTIATYSDGGMHLLYSFIIQGTADAGGSAQLHSVRVEFDRGLDDGGTAFELWRHAIRTVPPSATNTVSEIVWTGPPAPMVVFRAGTVGTPNHLNLIVSGFTTGGEYIAVAWVEWTLS